MKCLLLGVDRRAFQCLALCEVRVVTLGEEARLVASDDCLNETGRNLNERRKDTIREGIQTNSRSTDVEEESLHRCTRLRTARRLSHDNSVFCLPYPSLSR